MRTRNGNTFYFLANGIISQGECSGFCFLQNKEALEKKMWVPWKTH